MKEYDEDDPLRAVPFAAVALAGRQVRVAPEQGLQTTYPVGTARGG